MRNLSGAALSITTGLLALSCGRPPSVPSERTIVSYVTAPSLPGRLAADQDTLAIESQGGLVILDTASLSPILWRRGGAGHVEMALRARDGSDSVIAAVDLSRIAVFTTYQGTRYHPESIRAITEDSVILHTTAQRIVETMLPAGRGIFLDMQGAAPEDLPRIVALAREIRAAANLRGQSPVGIVVPATDTVAYPTDVLSKVADVIVVRLQGEHRSGTTPGAFASPDFISRALGVRAGGIGASRLIAELPLYGLRWSREGLATDITYAEAQALVAAETGSFRRDPSSQFLTASGRDGWTVWVPDARTVEAMMGAARRRGVNRFALAGVEAADPAFRVRETTRESDDK